MGDKSKWGSNFDRADEDRNRRDSQEHQNKEGKEAVEENLEPDKKKPRGNDFPRNFHSKGACEVCGLKNHSTDECRRKLFCELCGFANHVTLECKREHLWNDGPELCAAQVPKQSFFYIDESIDPETSKEKASTAIITVVRGELSGKMIENEFKRLVSCAQWKWFARRVADNKYTMRFPTAKMILDYSNFNLGIKNVDAQFTIEPWSSAMGAKGQLQQSRFIIKGIPIDQSGLRTIAKIGGLVGKAMVIDEGTRFNNDFLMVKIACRNANLVPPSVESSLGLFLYDFYFEREGPNEEDHDPLAAKITTNANGHQPSPMKQKKG